MAKFVRRRGFRSSGRKQNVQWSSVTGAFALAGTTGTQATAVIEVQSPVNLAAPLTSDPPEDLVLLRLRGSFGTTISAGPASWTVGLTVQDTAWTPTTGAGFQADSDKRWLWTRTFQTPAATDVYWYPPGTVWSGAVPVPVGADPNLAMVDIEPKVRLTPGQALYLVAYENSGTSTLSVIAADMRVLYKRAGRR